LLRQNLLFALSGCRLALHLATSQLCGSTEILSSTAIGNQSEVPRQRWPELGRIMWLRLELLRSLDQAPLGTGDAADL